MNELLNVLNKNKIANLKTIYTLENKNNEISRYYIRNDSVLAYIDEGPESFNVHFCAFMPEDVRYLSQFLEVGDNSFAGTQEWVLRMIKGNREYEYYEPCYQLYLPDSVELPPADIDICPIRPKDVDLVDSKWPFRHERSLEYMESRIKNGITGAVYNKDKLIAWCLTHGDNSLGHIFVLDEHRGKNYAYNISLYMIEKIREKGIIPYIFIVQENYKSVNLAQKLGFVIFEKVAWAKLIGH